MCRRLVMSRFGFRIHWLIVMLVFISNLLMALWGGDDAIVVAHALVVLRVCLELTANVSRSMCTLGICTSVYLGALNLFYPRVVLAAVVHTWVVLATYAFKLARAYILLLLNIGKVVIGFKRTFALRPCTHEILLHNIAVQTWHTSVNIQLTCLLSLVLWYFLAVDLCELRKHFDDEGSVLLVCCTRVVTEPENF